MQPAVEDTRAVREGATRAPGSRSAWLWILQRVSGLALVVLAGIHVGVQSGVLRIAFGRVTLLTADWLLLAIVLYHGLNGLRTVAFDYLSAPGAQRAVNGILWIGGLTLFAYGGWGLVLLTR